QAEDFAAPDVQVEGAQGDLLLTAPEVAVNLCEVPRFDDDVAGHERAPGFEFDRLRLRVSRRETASGSTGLRERLRSTTPPGPAAFTDFSEAAVRALPSRYHGTASSYTAPHGNGGAAAAFSLCRTGPLPYPERELNDAHRRPMCNKPRSFFRGFL